MYRLLFVEYEYFLDYEEITLDVSSQIATVLVDDDYEVILELSAESNPDDPTVTGMSGRDHKIVLRLEQGQWKIVSNEYSDNLWRRLRKRGLSPDEMLLTAQAPIIPAPASTPE